MLGAPVEAGRTTRPPRPRRTTRHCADPQRREPARATPATETGGLHRPAVFVFRTDDRNASARRYTLEVPCRTPSVSSTPHRPRPGRRVGRPRAVPAGDPRLVRVTFDAPTPAQTDGWRAIAAGHHTLIHAPTGSGKTLAAFLWCLDRLTGEPTPSFGPTASPRAGVRVLYVSPLKALTYDVERNLRAPLAGIALAAARLKRAAGAGGGRHRGRATPRRKSAASSRAARRTS